MESMILSTKKTSNKNKPKLPSLKEDFEVVKNLFTGRSIVFTGKGPRNRNTLIELAKKCGADACSNTITKKTNLLVVGEEAGSKLQKAMEKGIEIMSMNDFWKMISVVNQDEFTKNTFKIFS